ncbi:MAG: carbon storage regulator CsrA [Kineosporiaceae bacterium]
MLVLTRRAGESIVIGDEVRVVVLEVRGDTVRLGIEAPRSIQVHRAEVYAEVQAANAAAVSRADNLGSVAGRLQRMARPKPGPPPGRKPAGREPTGRKPAGREPAGREPAGGSASAADRGTPRGPVHGPDGEPDRG